MGGEPAVNPLKISLALLEGTLYHPINGKGGTGAAHREDHMPTITHQPHSAPVAPATVATVPEALAALERGDACPYALLQPHQKQEATMMAASCGSLGILDACLT
jgi:hypothetical protein